ncbi:monocyte chemotactic protein 1B-like [Alosa sapidissima]|uniref:monocyte chemotactic protein 1B-like n=1 Tax=Alosa sapidissima TaxID=34773 RepID=UPI001C08ACD0|nr:monocyte chemotactic protein 1B-like [Alosa sapidissima]
MNISAFCVCCLITICLILPAVSSTTTDCCLKQSSRQKLKANKVKTYHIQQQGGICPIHVVVFVTVRNKRICADPHRQWVKDTVRKVDERKTRRQGKGKKQGGRQARKQQAQ